MGVSSKPEIIFAVKLKWAENIHLCKSLHEDPSSSFINGSQSSEVTKMAFSEEGNGYRSR